MPEHPITRLRHRLLTDFVTDLPPGVFPVREWCAEPQFFPGASGLLPGASWSDVSPATQGAAHQFLPAPRRGVVVIAHYQASLDSYNRVINGDLHGLRRTWHFLPRLLAGIAPSELFLTNAYIGCPDVAKDNAPFPKTREHSRRCRDLLKLELELFDPRLVVCFGGPAARMLAEVVGGLDVWKGTWSFDGLEDSNARTVTNCTHAQSTFTAVVVKHPAAAVKKESRLLDIQRITDAARAPI